MEKIKILFLVLLVITVAFCAAVAYAFAVPEQSTLPSSPSSEWKLPPDCGIPYIFYAKEVEAPWLWCPAESAGVVVVEIEGSEYPYIVYIVDEEKAIPWMTNVPTTLGVRYNDKFYQLIPVHIDKFKYHPLGCLRNGTVIGAISSVLAVAWCLLGISFHKRRELHEKIEILAECLRKFAGGLRKRLLDRSKYIDLLRFLAFRESKPQHGIIRKISSWWLILLAYTPILGGYLIFRYIFPYGLVATIAVLVGISIVWLEILHVLCDR